MGGRAARRRCCVAAALAFIALAGAQPAAASVAPGEGAGGPVLVVTHPGDPFGRYYAEILRAEGLTGFAVAELPEVGPETLASHDAVLLAAGDVNDAQAAMLGEWVHAGGKLVAMRPDAALGDLLGLGTDVGDLRGGLRRASTPAPRRAAGITPVTMQVHGVSDRWTGGSARTVARLYADAATPTASPAVTLRSVGSAGGQAAAFTYDLARLRRRHAPGQHRLGGAEARDAERAGADPAARPLLPGLGGLRPDPHPAGRRAAAAAGQPAARR